MKIRLGIATAYPFQVQYRIRRVERYINGGDWLDYGCAEGGYMDALLAAGAATVSGVDVAPDRIAAAREGHPGMTFGVISNGLLPFADRSFDGIFMNEVFEHVNDEDIALSEARRVLRTEGYLILMSPNRWFLFEGHAVSIGRWTFNPTPFIPWMPKRLTDRWVSARNYWPKELYNKVASSGLNIVDSGFMLPVFECHKWLPSAMVKHYQSHITKIDRIAGIRKLLGVSNLVVAQRAD
jgi:SAM-dependent methyltransferase